MICTFFGHRNTPDSVEPLLRSLLCSLIEREGVTLFYVGNHGGFDAMVVRVLSGLRERYPISFCVVLTSFPEEKPTLPFPTVIPEGIELVPRRFAIHFRNRWMIRRSDVVVTYVTHSAASGAARCKALAERMGRRVVNLGSRSPQT